MADISIERKRRRRRKEDEEEGSERLSYGEELSPAYTLIQLKSTEKGETKTTSPATATALLFEPDCHHNYNQRSNMKMIKRPQDVGDENVVEQVTEPVMGCCATSRLRYKHCSKVRLGAIPNQFGQGKCSPPMMLLVLLSFLLISTDFTALSSSPNMNLIPSHLLVSAATVANGATVDSGNGASNLLTSQQQSISRDRSVITEALPTTNAIARYKTMYGCNKNGDRLIAQLLETVEKLLSQVVTGQKQSLQQFQRPSPNTWLGRVMSNPAYARLVQRLQAQKLAKQQQPIERTAQIEAQKEPNASGSVQQQQHDNNEAGYGKVVYYPHAISKPQQTIDLLHHLGHQQRQLANTESDDLESNRIPPISLARGLDGPSSYNELARNKIVYGNVLYRPSQNTINNNQQHQQQSFNTLRRMSADWEPTNPHNLQSVGSDNGEPNAILSQRQQLNGGESYGHILVSPPTSPNQLQSEQSTTATRREGDPDSDSNNADGQQAISLSPLATNKQSRLNKPRQLGPHQFIVDGDIDGDIGSSSSSGSKTSNEVATHGNSMAFLAESGAGNEGHSVQNEFEGEFHSAPLQQIEVRQLRSNGHVEIHTASSPKKEFLVD